MNINGILPIFKKKRGAISFFEGSISKKNKDGSYTNLSIEVKFGNKEKFDEKTLALLTEDNCYTLEIKDGFISVDAWEDKITHQQRRKPVLVIVDAVVKSTTPIDKSKLKANKTDNGLPF